MEINDENEKIELLITKTPFYMEKNWELLLENNNANCSHHQIDELLHKKIISLIDIEIIKALAQYRFTNTNNLAFYLNDLSGLHKLYQKCSYTSNIKKLKKAGIITCHHFVSTSIPTQAPPSQPPVSPLRLYSLSPGAFTYIEPLIQTTAPQTPTTTPRKLELAALSQFLLHFQYYYPNNIKHLSYLNIHKIGSTPFTIDALIHYKTSNDILGIQDYLSIFVLSVRKYNNWIKETRNRLRMLNIWITRHIDKYRTPLILLLIEDLDMVTTLYAETQIGNIIQLPLYFLPDTLLMVYAPFSCIYSCEIAENKIIATRCSFNI